MNTSDLFYIVAIVFMVVHLVILVSGAIVLYRFVQGVQTSIHRVERLVSSVSIAKYSFQMTLLKKVLNLFGRGGERT
jgi:hypothetical protein